MWINNLQQKGAKTPSGLISYTTVWLENTGSQQMNQQNLRTYHRFAN